jgi:hypothetical protein
LFFLQAQLVRKLLSPFKVITIPDIETVCYRCEDFKRLWSRLVEIENNDQEPILRIPISADNFLWTHF